MKSKFLYRLNLWLVLIEGMFVLFLLGYEPSETSKMFLFGYSQARLIVLLVVILSLSLLLWLLIRSYGKHLPDSFEGRFILRNRFQDKLPLYVLLLFILGCSYYFFFADEHFLGWLFNYKKRLIPIVGWLGMISIQGLFSLLFFRFFERADQWYDIVWKPGLTFLVLLSVLAGFIYFSKIGVKPDKVYWESPGTPLLFYQVLIVSALIFLVSRFGLKRSVREKKGSHILIGILIWLSACILWISQPAKPVYNFRESGPPNFTRYPHGDAAMYDLNGQNILLGNPNPPDLREKPLYSLFLAGLHLIYGQDFESLITLQVFILAVIPVFGYLLMKSVGYQLAGILLAYLIIFRELNSISLSNTIEVSHSKLLLTDVPAMGFMILLVWLVVKAIKKGEGGESYWYFFIGGFLGLFTFVRGQAIFITLFVIFTSLLFSFKHWTTWIRNSILVLFGVSIVLLPWVWKVSSETGKIALQNPNTLYTSQLALMYSDNPTEEVIIGPEVEKFPGETEDEYYARLRRNMILYIFQHPVKVASFISAHYFHNMVSSYIYLPHSFRIESLRNYVREKGFWKEWRGNLDVSARVLLAVNLIVLSIGFGHIWQKSKILFFVSLILGAGYNLSDSVARLSGWRFILPADWVTLLFYSVGLVQIMTFMHKMLFVDKQEKDPIDLPQKNISTKSFSPLKFLLTAGVFFSIGYMISYGEIIFNKNLPERTSQELLDSYSSTTVGAQTLIYSDHDIEQFTHSVNAVILHGKGLYPRYLEEKALNFYVTGSPAYEVTLPIDKVVNVFPSGTDVLIIGCRVDNAKFSNYDQVEALRVILLKQNIVYDQQPRGTLKCLGSTN